MYFREATTKDNGDKKGESVNFIFVIIDVTNIIVCFKNI